MALGELTNFVAYIFAPAILVTPLGVFSIVCTAVLSPYFLKETLNAIGKLGCVLVLVGCVMVTLCGPKDREVATMEELQSQLLHPGFIIYSAIVVGTSGILMAMVSRYGHRYVMLYITICSSFGSLSVMFCKGVGLALKQTFMGTNEFTDWPTWVCIFCLVACLLIETAYMQRALDLFNSSVFMSVNYVMFTSLVIIASSILYSELHVLGWKNIILTILGFVVNIAALYLLHLDKEDSDPQIPPADSSTIHSPDQDPETPLMVAKLGEKSREHSPLSNINLSPSMLKDNAGKLLTFLSKDTLGQDRSVYLPSNDSRRNSSRGENNNFNEESKSALNRMCEIPLITELRRSSSSKIKHRSDDEESLTPRSSGSEDLSSSLKSQEGLTINKLQPSPQRNNINEYAGSHA